MTRHGGPKSIADGCVRLLGELSPAALSGPAHGLVTEAATVQETAGRRRL